MKTEYNKKILLQEGTSINTYEVFREFQIVKTFVF